eukprot:223925-Chlamydomonas_euryale.AAC.2
MERPRPGYALLCGRGRLRERGATWHKAGQRVEGGGAGAKHTFEHVGEATLEDRARETGGLNPTGKGLTRERGEAAA